MAMNERYRVVRRGERDDALYCFDTETQSRTSLGTKDPDEAERLVQHKNEALKNPQMNQKIGMTYLAGVNPDM